MHTLRGWRLLYNCSDHSVITTKKYWCYLTCLLDPFSYSIIETARWTRPIRWCLDFKSSEATKHISGFLFIGLGIRFRRSMTRVGSIFSYSSMTASQWNCFTAVTVSLKIESWTSELSLFISARILRAISTIVDVEEGGVFTIIDARDL